MRRKRGYDDYQSQEPASGMSLAVAESEPVASGKKPANLVPLLAAAPSGKLSGSQAGMLAHRLGNRGFSDLISRNPHPGLSVSPRDEFAALQEVVSGSQQAIFSRSAEGLESSAPQAPTTAGGVISSGGVPSSGAGSEIAAPSSASGSSSGGISIPSSASQPPSTMSMPGTQPLSQMAAKAPSGIATGTQAGSGAVSDNATVIGENSSKGGAKSGNAGIGLGTVAEGNPAQAVTGPGLSGEPTQKGNLGSSRFRSAPPNLSETSFTPFKPPSHRRSNRRSNVRSTQDQTEREAGVITSQAGRVGSGVPSHGDTTTAHTPGASDVTASSQQQGQIAVNNTPAGGREADLDHVGRNAPAIELEPGTPITVQTGVRERMQALLQRTTETLRNTFRETAARTKEVVTRIGTGVANTSRAIIGGIRNAVGQARSLITNVLTSVQGTLGRMASAVMALVTRARTAVSRLIERVTSAAGGIADWVRNQVTALKRIAIEQVVAMIRSVRTMVVNWLAAQAVRTVTLIHLANQMIRGFISLSFTQVSRQLIDNRDKLHRDVERHLGSSSPLPPRARLQYRRYIRQMASMQVLAQTRQISQRLRGALMPYSLTIAAAALVVHTEYTNLLAFFPTAFAEPLRQADQVTPGSSASSLSGFQQIAGSTGYVAGMSIIEWAMTEMQMRMYESGLTTTAMLFASV